MIIPSRTFSSLLSPQTILEIDRIRDTELSNLEISQLSNNVHLEDGVLTEEVVTIADIDAADEKFLSVSEQNFVEDVDDGLMSESITLKDEAWMLNLSEILLT
jgi:Flp pilus assembly CpaE family ATPase